MFWFFFAVFISGIIIILTPLLIKFYGKIELSGHIVSFALIVALLVFSYYTGGLTAHINIWFSTLVILSLLATNFATGLVYTTIFIIYYLCTFFFDEFIPAPYYLDPDKEKDSCNFFIYWINCCSFFANHGFSHCPK